MISVHFNGIDDPSKKGTQTFYSEGRPFSEKNMALAELVQASLVRNIRGAGYETADRGATNDSRVLGQGSHYYLLGPESPTIRRPSEMPGIIGEALFLTSTEDAQALRQEKVLEGVARGYFEAIRPTSRSTREVGETSPPAREQELHLVTPLRTRAGETFVLPSPRERAGGEVPSRPP